MRLRWPIFCIVALLITGLSFAVRTAIAQCCTPTPAYEISEVFPVEHGAPVSQFRMAIGDSTPGDPSGTNFDGMSVQEEYGSQGTNSCYYSEGPLPPHPVVSNPGNGVPPWVVGTLNDGTSLSGYWGYDLIGVPPELIHTLRREKPELVASGCALVTFQDMWISCGEGHPNYYERDNVLQMFIRPAEVENCRKAVLDSANRCERLPFQTPSQ